MRKSHSILIILVIGIHFVKAQKEEPVDIFNDAEYFFATGDYQEAAILFLKLIILQPDNSNFNFRTGMCYLSIPGQEKSFIFDLTNSEDDEKISISYDKKTDLVKIISSKQKNYNINVTDIK